MFYVNVTVKAPNYDTLRKGVLAISRQIPMFALLPPGSIHYFKIPGRTPAERAKQPVIIAELLEYTWLENKEREGGRIHGLYLAQSITPRQFQELPKRPLFALMGWEVTERSLG